MPDRLPLPGVRNYRASDRQAALARGLRPEPLDSGRLELTVASAGPIDGYAAWVDGQGGSPPELGEVWTRTDDRRLFYRLVALAAQQALDRGHTRAAFTVNDRRLLVRLRRDFRIVPVVEGVDTRTGEPASWRVEVDLANARRQLERYV